jgi:hypothetical protein
MATATSPLRDQSVQSADINLRAFETVVSVAQSDLPLNPATDLWGIASGGFVAGVSLVATIVRGILERFGIGGHRLICFPGAGGERMGNSP